MQYTDKQIEEAVEKTVVQKPMATFVDLTRLIMRMVRAELANRVQVHLEGAHQVTRIRSLNPLPEFWKEPEEAPKETRFGGVDVSNGSLTVEKQAQRWQHIKTVPLNSGPGHSVFIAHTSLCRSGISAFYEQGRWRDANSGAPIAWYPTHWMPIPQLPEDK